MMFWGVSCVCLRGVCFSGASGGGREPSAVQRRSGIVRRNRSGGGIFVGTDTRGEGGRGKEWSDLTSAHGRERLRSRLFGATTESERDRDVTATDRRIVGPARGIAARGVARRRRPRPAARRCPSPPLPRRGEKATTTTTAAARLGATDSRNDGPASSKSMKRMRDGDGSAAPPSAAGGAASSIKFDGLRSPWPSTSCAAAG